VSFPRICGPAKPAVSTSLAVAAALLLWWAPSAGAAAVATHAAESSPAQVREYWTPERMRAAEPIEAASGAGGPVAHQSAAPPDQEIDPALDTTYPFRIHGRLFLRMGGGDAECSATVVTSFRRNVILTAGHCVALPLGGGRTLWARDILFVPAYRDGSAPLGTYPGTSVGAPVLWAVAGDLSFDAGVVTLAPGPGGEIQDVLGSRGLAFNRPLNRFRRKSFQIFGYPAEPAAFYDGERPILCESRFVGIDRFSGGLLTSPCNQQQGASGGGWVMGGSLVISLISHAGCRSPSGCQVISGTYLGEAVFRLWSRAGGLSPGRKKRIRRCKRLGDAKRLRCLARAETFRPVVL
jgi:hypothetical protein